MTARREKVRRMARRNQRWDVGDVFVVPLSDGAHGVGQIVGREAEVLNSVSVALFDTPVHEPEGAADLHLAKESVFAVLFATRDLLDRGRWKVVARRPVEIPREWLPFERLRATGWIGAKVIGSGIVEEFLHAYFGLVPWDDWADPKYLDSLLLTPAKKPPTRVLKLPPQRIPR
jgi:hypothetical protein